MNTWIKNLKIEKKHFLMVIAFIFAGFQIYTTILGSMPEIKQRAAHLGFVIIFLFSSYPFSKKKKENKTLKIIDLIFMVGGVISTAYLFINFNQIVRRGGISTTTDVIMGVILFCVIMEGTRRSSGWPLVIVSSIFIIYARFGSIFPGILAHANFKTPRLVDHLFLSVEGIFGIPLGVSATYLYLFVLFGSILSVTGATQLFIDFGLSLTGKRPGGEAKVAIVASALLGTVSGSSPANVATTGSFTIPLMKRSGFSPEFAGAVESVASTGGQILPPIMGAAAFIMAQYINVSYFTVARAAVIPALMYYIGCWTQVHFHSIKHGLHGLDELEVPKMRDVLRSRGQMFIPILFLVIMIIRGFSAIYSAFFAIITTILISSFRKDTRITWGKLKEAILMTAMNVAAVSVATAVCGVVVGIVSLSGTALLMGNSIIALAKDNLFIVLFLTMLLSIVMGMGMPTSAVYIVCATFAAPVITRMGIPILVSHMFVFYFGCMASITPPVAVASIVAAGIAGASVNKTGFLAFRLAIAGFIVPYFFVYTPALIGDYSIWSTIIATVICLLALISLGASMEGYFFTNIQPTLRWILGLGAVLLVLPGMPTNVIGLIIVMVIVVLNFSKSKKEKNVVRCTKV